MKVSGAASISHMRLKVISKTLRKLLTAISNAIKLV
ncbi:hypothetical protein [Salmonella phage vB_SenM-S16]|uniref:Uncharacterized protein n=1 Tax=Salmonella phage S16 TaxID=1087482 RepID=M1GU78_BPS16|nr:hypothetical protein I133_gp144 [Salmonella phage vB_SenM-S16]AGE48185.1 hypothetical protein [Salmonella phage vB_SenM-S16]